MLGVCSYRQYTNRFYMIEEFILLLSYESCDHQYCQDPIMTEKALLLPWPS